MYERERSNIEIFQKIAQMPFKGPRYPNRQNRRRKTYCNYGQRSKVCKKAKKSTKREPNGPNRVLMAKIRHFPSILCEKDQRLYSLQMSKEFKNDHPEPIGGPQGLLLCQPLKKNYRQSNGVVGYTSLITLQYLT